MNVFYIGQIFEETYPPEVAIWCNENNAFIEELAPVEDVRCFEIKAVPLLTLEEVRDRKKKEAENALTEKIAEITPYYPTDEKVSFSKQEAEALIYSANPEVDPMKIPCIYGIALGRQIELDVLVSKILNKAALFSRLSGLYMGRKQRIEDLADQAQTVAEVEAIDVQAIFAEPLE